MRSTYNMKSKRFLTLNSFSIVILFTHYYYIIATNNARL